MGGKMFIWWKSINLKFIQAGVSEILHDQNSVTQYSNVRVPGESRALQVTDWQKGSQGRDIFAFFHPYYKLWNINLFKPVSGFGRRPRKVVIKSICSFLWHTSQSSFCNKILFASSLLYFGKDLYAAYRLWLIIFIHQTPQGMPLWSRGQYWLL